MPHAAPSFSFRTLLASAGHDGGLDRDAVVKGLSYDSRLVEPGDLVLVTYVRVNDQLRAQRIVRVEGSPQQR